MQNYLKNSITFNCFKKFMLKSVMKKNIHPNYHNIKVEMTDGTNLKLDLHGERRRSTWLKLIQNLILLGRVENKN